MYFSKRIALFCTKALHYILQCYLISDPLGEEYSDKLDEMGMKNVQKKKKVEPMWEKTKVLIDDFHRPYNRKLADMLNDKRFLWNPEIAPMLE